MKGGVIQNLAAEIKHLKVRLNNFLKRYRNCIKMAPSRRHMNIYVSGQIGHVESIIEAIALNHEATPRKLASLYGYIGLG